MPDKIESERRIIRSLILFFIVFCLFPASNAIRIGYAQTIRCPKFKPAFKEFIVDDEGRLIVVVDDRAHESAVLDFFDREGRWIKRILANIPVSGLRISNHKAYATSTVDGFFCVKRFSFNGDSAGSPRTNGS